jgi:aminoglycoside 6'-N-acetyltransferase
VGLRLHGALTEVQPATAEDVALLVAWHADPGVARYWDGRTFTEAEMRARLGRPDVDAYIVEAAGQPVGYLQTWREGDEGGLDMFLVPEARGRGYGPDAARAVARALSKQGWTRITVDPYVWNGHAIEAWKRAGFRPVERWAADGEHTSDWLLMEFRDAIA